MLIATRRSVATDRLPQARTLANSVTLHSPSSTGGFPQPRRCVQSGISGSPACLYDRTNDQSYQNLYFPALFTSPTRKESIPASMPKPGFSITNLARKRTNVEYQQAVTNTFFCRNWSLDCEYSSYSTMPLTFEHVPSPPAVLVIFFPLPAVICHVFRQIAHVCSRHRLPQPASDYVSYDG